MPGTQSERTGLWGARIEKSWNSSSFPNGFAVIPPHGQGLPEHQVDYLELP